MTDEVLDNILKQLQETNSEEERYKILGKNKLWRSEICDLCKSAHKFEDLNMCVIVEDCKWDLSYRWFRKERQKQNSLDCKNNLDNECVKHLKSCSKDNHEKCMTCKHFEKKENKLADK